MHIGRPLQFDPDQALLTAMDIFWQRGYEASSMQDLLAAMGIAKSSFYQAFGSKRQLFERCLARYRERQVERMTAALTEAPSAHHFLRSVLRSMIPDAAAKQPYKGCLAMNTATEFAGRDAAITDLVLDCAESFAGVFHQAIQRAQAEGDIPQDRNAEVLARYVVMSVTGLKILVKAGLSAAAIEAVAETAIGALQ